MSYHAILNLTCPTDADAKKAKITEEIITTAEAVYAEGMSIPKDEQEQEQEQEIWTVQWDMCLVCGVATQIINRLTGLQGMLEVILQKVRDHSMEPQVAGHIVAKMEEVHPMCAWWQEEVVVWHKAKVWKAEEAQEAEEVQCIEEEQQVALSMLFKLTRLLGSATVLGKGKEKGKGHKLVHAPNACMSII